MPPPYRLHVFVCTNKRPEGAIKPSCGHNGGEEIRDAFKQGIAARGLKQEIRANAAGCLDACYQGPALVIYPEETWYGPLRLEDVDEIIDEHLVGGRPVERLLMRLSTKKTTKLTQLRSEAKQAQPVEPRGKEG